MFVRLRLQDSRLHADLIKRYIDRLSDLLGEPTTKQHLRQQGLIAIELVVASLRLTKLNFYRD